MKNLTIDFTRCPERFVGGLSRYFNNRIAPGGFLKAVLANNLRETFARADADSIGLLLPLLIFLYNEAPAAAWGSGEKVERWLAGDCAHGVSRADRCFDCDPNTGTEDRT